MDFLRHPTFFVTCERNNNNGSSNNNHNLNLSHSDNVSHSHPVKLLFVAYAIINHANTISFLELPYHLPMGQEWGIIITLPIIIMFE
jgi:hypothetical protein